MDILKPFVEFFWGFKGCGEVALYGQKFQLHEDDLFYYLPGETHLRYALSEHWQVRWLCFDGPLAEAFMLAFKYPRFFHASNPYPAALFTELEQVIGEKDPNLIRRAAAIVMDILAYAGGSYPQGAQSGKIIKQAIDQICSQLADPVLDLQKLSDNLNVSKNKLTRLFRENTGLSPGRYILDRRLELAQTLLRSTDLPVGEVAMRCGFHEPRTFNRFIRRSLNCTPLEVRKRR